MEEVDPNIDVAVLEDGDPIPEAREPTPKADQDEEKPGLPPLSTVGSLIQGVFWVYGCEQRAPPKNPTSSKIVAIQMEQVIPPLIYLLMLLPTKTGSRNLPSMPNNEPPPSLNQYP